MIFHYDISYIGDNCNVERATGLAEGKNYSEVAHNLDECYDGIMAMFVIPYENRHQCNYNDEEFGVYELACEQNEVLISCDSVEVDE